MKNSQDRVGSTKTLRRTTLDLQEALVVGMAVAVHARDHPDRRALMGEQGELTYTELNARSNQLLRALWQRGLRAGDAVAILCSNRFEFVETYVALLRGGLRLTPINWHLQVDEVAYIVDNCDAKAFLAEATFADVAIDALALAPKVQTAIAIAGEIEGFEGYEAALAQNSADDPREPIRGGSMLYTSGTTGRPKGVSRDPSATSGAAANLAKAIQFEPATDVVLATGPLYHAANMSIILVAPLSYGTGIALLEKFDPETCLKMIDGYLVTMTHMVATMFHRMLSLPEEVKQQYDTSSLRYILHGAAPTPVHVKRAMLDWFGPVLYEYYGGTEGSVSLITPQEWLEKPGSVGRPASELTVEIRDEDQQPLSVKETGTVFIKTPESGRFAYYKDKEKTETAFQGDFFTMGDLGYLDEDGYLYLTGRSAEVIISGGVNIYPAETDGALLLHSSVADVATVGVPSQEWGEEVRSVVQLKPGVEPSEALERELIAFTRARIAHFKSPRSIRFDPHLPRRDDGKVLRRLVRERYWP